MSDCVLRVDSISKKFGGLTAVADFSMEIGKNEIKGIIGPNGAGKTTIFNLITRIYDVDSGKIYLDGEDITKLPQEIVARKGLSRTFQNIRLFENLSVLQNIKVAIDYTAKYSILEAFLRVPKVAKEEKRIEQQAREALELVGLEKYAEERPKNLPYGIQRRVEIARALVMKAKIILLDEPAAGLNPEEVYTLTEFLRSLKEQKDLSILIIEHRMDLIMNLCDYIYVQDFGVNIASGTVDEIQTSPAVLTAYLGEEEHDA